jgi:hypothetical protein
VLVRNALFHRVQLCARRDWDALGDLDGDSGWDAEAWADAVKPYFDVHAQIGVGPDARGPALLVIEQEPERWLVRQVFDDPAGDRDWGFTAEVDLAASDEAGTAVLHITAAGEL